MALPISDKELATDADDTGGTAEITVEQRMEAIENVVIQLAATVQHALVEPPATAPAPEAEQPVTDEQPQPVQGPAFKAPRGTPKPPISKAPQPRERKKAPQRKKFDSSKLTDEPGTASFKQKKALSGLTQRLAAGNRVKYLGDDTVKQYWSFLSLQEASRAIDALKSGKPFKFSNKLVVYPR